MKSHHLILALVAVCQAAACSDAGTGPSQNPLAGLTLITAAPPPTSTDPHSGVISGDVRGYTGTGADSLASTHALAGVAVTLYTRIATTSGVAAGEQVAQTTTDANGHFALPSEAEGSYIVTFVPPSAYAGAWSLAWIEGSYTPGLFAELKAK